MHQLYFGYVLRVRYFNAAMDLQRPKGVTEVIPSRYHKWQNRPFSSWTRKIIDSYGDIMKGTKVLTLYVPSWLVNTYSISWWRHEMETFSALLAICAGIHRSTVNSPHKGQSRGALMFSLICALMDGWVNNRETGDLRRHRTQYDVTVIYRFSILWFWR